MKKYWKIVWNGITPSNPILILAIGLCSVVAVTNSVQNALLMTLSLIHI